ncbi:8-amino-7-oxononanoate synthase [Limibacter armeniacum]|uniref:aminotransferase class I/II-fold pyridoxal phosphate-dependent enzyme n=1 Tax=Limibacter armeniacum TaxID=466084 RepID=UPI002FE61A5A
MDSFYGKLAEQNWTDFRLGAASSRLLGGNHELYSQLESVVAKSYNREAALLFNSGYHANLGVLPALTQKGDLILSDKLNHASIIDGIRLSEADVMRYRHLDYTHLETLLKKYRHQYRNVVIVTESVFSMDGDLVDLHALVSLKETYNTLLYVDEAHAVGIFGNKGLGLCEFQNVIGQIDVIVCPLGKAVASYGALVVTDELIRNLLINRSRTLIFSTALPPVQVQWSLHVWGQLPKLTERRKALRENSLWLRSQLELQGWLMPSSSHIIPVITGEVKGAISLAEKLESYHYMTLPVRPPTVPVNQARLRLSLTSSISKQQLLPLLSCTGEIVKHLNQQKTIQP